MNNKGINLNSTHIQTLSFQKESLIFHANAIHTPSGNRIVFHSGKRFINDSNLLSTFFGCKFEWNENQSAFRIDDQFNFKVHEIEFPLATSLGLAVTNNTLSDASLW